MVKKLKKYVKFVVCCALMLSLIAPSYAALSASDGSAFVTKAEFDSALADFNARLTTFEAGINSKIDSQVTSYLDRNGIWSGKAQEIAYTDDIGYQIKSGTASSDKIVWNTYAKGGQGWVNETAYGAPVNITGFGNGIIALTEITKSGLLVIYLEEQAWSRDYYSGGGVTGGYASSCFNGSLFSWELYFSKSDDGSTKDLPIEASYIEFGQLTGQGLIPRSVTKSSHMFLCFVQAKETLKFFAKTTRQYDTTNNNAGPNLCTSESNQRTKISGRIIDQKLYKMTEALVY